MTSDDNHALFLRGAQELFRMLTFRGQPPGTGTRILGLAGRDQQGDEVELIPDSDALVLRRRDTTDAGERLSPEEAMSRLGDGSLILETVLAVPDVAGGLFSHAVRQAEESLRQYREAEEQAEPASAVMGQDRGEGVVEFVLWATALDRTVPSAITAIALAVATAEAQVNAWASGLRVSEGAGSTEPDDEELPRILRRIRALARRAGVEIDVDEAPWGDLRKVVRRRNQLVHTKPRQEEVPLLEAGHEAVPGYGWSLQARRGCWAVRQALVALAEILGLEKPRYLAACPPTAPDDDDAWRTAHIMTGGRADPDFPPAGQA